MLLQLLKFTCGTNFGTFKTKKTSVILKSKLHLEESQYKLVFLLPVFFSAVSESKGFLADTVKGIAHLCGSAEGAFSLKLLVFLDM